MRRRLATAAAFFLLCVSTLPSGAQDPADTTAGQDLVVMELFTSQGCSSCPPGDAILTRLAQRDDVLALSLHVDYWDYIGWKDAFASPANTQRQKGYAMAAGRHMIYTPQMVVMGQDGVVGGDAMAVSEALMAQQKTTNPVRISVTQTEDLATLTMETTGTVTGTGLLTIEMVRYAPENSVVITRGELAGRTLSYTNVVKQRVDLGQWDGTGVFSVTVPVEGDLKAAFLVQEDSYGPILGAAKLD